MIMDGGAGGGGGGVNNLHHSNNHHHHNKGGGVREGIPHTGYIRLRGLPFNTTTEDIMSIFKEYNPKVDSALVTYRFDGRATGEGYVAFDNIDDEHDAKVNQLVRLIHYLQCLPVKTISIDKVEADDVIAQLSTTLAEK